MQATAGVCMMQATLLEADLDIKAANQSSNAGNASQALDSVAKQEQQAARMPANAEAGAVQDSVE